jgi:hypothetical protein
LESSYFCYLGAHAKFQIPTICPYWGLATKKQEEKKEKNMQNSDLRLSDTVCTAPLGPIAQFQLKLPTGAEPGKNNN